MLVVDPRLEQVKKVVEGLVTKTLLYSTECLVTSDNTLVLVVDDTLLYTIPLKNEMVYPILGFSYARFMELVGDREIDFSKEPIDIQDVIITQRIAQLHINYMSLTSCCSLVAYNEDLKNDESFADYLNIRADDGMRYYRLLGINPANQYLIPIFTGFPNIASQDKLGIYVYNIGNGFLLGVFKIFKKKINRDIEIQFRILNLIGR